MSGKPPPALEVSALRYETPGRVLLDDVELHLAQGESAAVTGPSGSGKSTLLSCLLGLIRPAAGRITIAGTDIGRLSPRRLARHRRDTTGMVFQFGELLPELTPVENVALAALLAGTGRKDAFGRARQLLDDLGVPAVGTPTADLSGGERQRTAVARALVNRPTLLLADEPTGALDERNRENVADLLFSLPGRWGCAVLVVTHDVTVAARADRRYALSDGVLTPAATSQSYRAAVNLPSGGAR
ncbi:ABC transporter ATP-binding protein [Streptomyces chryseus]|uniref:Lipoprotein-releasing system ATP-binding protein LolD n=1 Tax=Streptomyces chryseus TaxID=68186 RepID=A0ABQ3DVU1_9ACTN|nr:ABC transporter ATP-binding protein [Streptomyces chryseus]GGX19691.1 lipoprotein-releasing system ATP-binding protein LolD [Streptomyces chryseus]GHB17397.1 lipoprotein-releasing system ATP-binding protein LolD [Streptomyces chryseus]